MEMTNPAGTSNCSNWRGAQRSMAGFQSHPAAFFYSFPERTGGESQVKRWWGMIRAKGLLPTPITGEPDLTWGRFISSTDNEKQVRMVRNGQKTLKRLRPVPPLFHRLDLPPPFMAPPFSSRAGCGRGGCGTSSYLHKGALGLMCS